MPVTDSTGKTVAAVYVDIPLDWLNDVMEESRVYKNTQRFILSRKGNLLAGEDCETLRQARKKLNADSNKTGYSTMKDENGEKQHVFYHPIGGETDWVLISVNDDSEVFGRLRSVRIWLLSMVLVGMGLLAFIVIRVGKHLERIEGRIDHQTAVWPFALNGGGKTVEEGIAGCEDDYSCVRACQRLLITAEHVGDGNSNVNP